MGFLDKVGNVVDKASKASNNFAKKKKLELDNSKLESNIKKQYEEIGRVYYQMKETGEVSDKLREYFARVDDFFTEIAENKKVIKELEPDVFVCVDCGTKLEEGSKFCNSCGGKAVLKDEKTDVGNGEGSSCPNCGAEADGSSKFCTNCGNSLED